MDISTIAVRQLTVADVLAYHAEPLGLDAVDVLELRANAGQGGVAICRRRLLPLATDLGAEAAEALALEDYLALAGRVREVNARFFGLLAARDAGEDQAESQAERS